MHTLVYDHTFEGFLSAVFYVYEYKLTNVVIVKQALHQTAFFEEVTEVYTSHAKAQRVANGVETIIGKAGMHTLLYAFLSENAEVEIHLLAVIRRLFTTKDGTVLGDYANEHVLALSKLVKSVGREKHRMEAFVRFELTKDSIYAATIYPDFDVLLLIKNHFYNRYKDQQWLIYDVCRDYGLYYDLKTVEIITLDTTAELKNKANNAEAELEYQQLWKEYFEHTNIVERKNMKLHLQHVPKRYWKYLTEKR